MNRSVALFLSLAGFGCITARVSTCINVSSVMASAIRDRFPNFKSFA